MDHSKFKETENKYMELKSSLEGGSISSEELKLKLKQMMIKDEDGNYWMIGSNTGKWYIYNGTDWKEKDPYSGGDLLSKTQNFNNISSETIIAEREEESEEQEIVLEKSMDSDQDSHIVIEQKEDEQIVLEQKEEEISFGQQEEEQKTFQAESVVQREDEPVIRERQDAASEPVMHEPASAGEPAAQTEDTTVHCIICKSKIDNHSVYCSYCGANQKELSSKKAKPGEEMLIRSFRITSLIFFFGGLGLIAGVIFGATFGIFDIFGDLLAKFPEMLVEYRGKLQGGLIFAALGGIFGFFSFAVFFGVSGLIYNAFSYLFGGIRIRTR